MRSRPTHLARIQPARSLQRAEQRTPATASHPLSGCSSRPSCAAVPDMSNFYEQHKSVKPFLVTAPGVDTSVENYQSKEDRAKLDGMSRVTPTASRLLTRSTISLP